MNKTVTIVIIGLLIGIGVGYALGYTRVSASYAPKIAVLNRMFPTPTLTFSLSGKVKQVTGNTLTIEDATIGSNPFIDLPSVREVTITNTTKIVKIGQKDAATYQAEMVAFQKKAQQNRTASSAQTQIPTPPPSMIGETVISLSALKVGDMVSVVSTSDILKAVSFTAEKVQLMDIKSGFSVK